MNHSKDSPNMISSTNKYRTMQKAGDTVNPPKCIVTITHPEYQYALSFKRDKLSEGKSIAYLSKLTLSDDMTGDNLQSLDFHVNGDKLYLGDIPVVETDFRDLVTDKRISELNTQMLSAIFSILYKCYKEEMDSTGKSISNMEDFSIDVYIPSLMFYICHRRNYSEKQRQAMIRSLQEFHSIIGVFEKKDNGRTKTDRYALLLLQNTKESTNTLRISSPYMMELLQRLSIERTKKKKNAKNKNEEIKIPNYTFLIKGTIVEVVVRLIVQAGERNMPRIKANNIINKCPLLNASLNNCTNNAEKNKLLKKVFATAWRYLKEHTYLQDRYIEFVIPNFIPSMQSLDYVIVFIHKGINRKFDFSQVSEDNSQ